MIAFGAIIVIMGIIIAVAWGSKEKMRNETMGVLGEVEKGVHISREDKIRIGELKLKLARM